MLKNLGDRELLMLALAPVAIFIIVAFILIVGPRIGLLPRGEATVTSTAAATLALSATIAPPTPTVAPSPTASLTPSITPVPPTATSAPVVPSSTPATSILLRREQLSPG